MNTVQDPPCHEEQPTESVVCPGLREELDVVHFRHVLEDSLKVEPGALGSYIPPCMLFLRASAVALCIFIDGQRLFCPPRFPLAAAAKPGSMFGFSLVAVAAQEMETKGSTAVRPQTPVLASFNLPSGQSAARPGPRLQAAKPAPARVPCARARVCLPVCSCRSLRVRVCVCMCVCVWRQLEPRAPVPLVPRYSLYRLIPTP